METVELTTDEYAVLCGLVQPSEDVNAIGIYSDAWEGLREKFPLRDFRLAVEAGVISYDKEA